ncbi:MAG: ABC transporter permease subunit [Clostridia bacterium]|nr:ABC transporter permease subunit [Clostridia bacterium]
MKFRIAVTILIVALLLCGCSSQPAEQKASDGDSQKLEYSSISELSDVKRFAMCMGTIFDEIVAERYPDAKILYFPSPVDCALAVAKNKADACIYDAPVLQYIADCTSGVGVIPEFIMKDNYHFCLSKSDSSEWLQIEFNEWLAVQKQTGETDRMYEFWCSNAEPDTVFDFSALPDTNGVIRIAVSPGSRPDVYYFQNGFTGYSVELIYNFCRDRGFGGEIIVASDSMLPLLDTGKADIGICFLSYTEERAESIRFTDPILESGIGVLVRTDEKESFSFLNFLINGFTRTFIREGRWRLLINGLVTAMLITIGGFLLANILGIAFGFCLMSKRKVLRGIADVYDRVMQGTPMVVILMILYYVIFGNADIAGSWVAIIAFGLTSGAALARLFYVTVSSIDIGQTEAALSLGFSNARAFIGIVLPQATRMALPGYFSELIGLMKATSIVGYISVVDLTKAGDLIRSSTYDAFFPLLSVALIYFLISFALLSLLKHFQKMLMPKRVVAQKEETK